MLNINEVNPYIRVAMHSVLNTGIEIQRRIIFDYELIYVEKGEMVFFYGGERYKVGKGKFIFIRPSVPHSFEKIISLHQPHIHFDFIYSKKSDTTPVCFKDLPALSAEERQLISEDYFKANPVHPFIVFENSAEALRLFYGAIDAYVDRKYLLAKGYLTSLISHLIADNFHDAISSDNTVYGIARQILDIIDSEQGLNYSLYDLERQLSYSKFYLERQFKKEYDISIIAYQSEKRLTKAAKMLEAFSVSQVASELGYSSIYSFSRAFKNKYGVSPSKYIRLKNG